MDDDDDHTFIHLLFHSRQLYDRGHLENKQLDYLLYYAHTTHTVVAIALEEEERRER